MFALDSAEFVACCYATFLGRVVDEGGLSAYLSAQKSKSKFEVAFDIASSEEGQLKRTCLSGFADIVVDEYVARIASSPDAATTLIETAVQYLGNLPRDQLSEKGRAFLFEHDAVSNARESALPAVDAASLFAMRPAEFVVCCYLAFLDRVPGEEELRAYLGALGTRSKFELAFDIANSEEGRLKQMYLSGFADVVVDEYSTRIAEAPANVEGLVRAAVGYLEAIPRQKLSQRGRDFLAEHVTIRSGALRIRRRGVQRELSPVAAPSFWVDLTGLLQEAGAAPGLLRTQLELARHIKLSRPDARFFTQVLDGFVEIGVGQLGWLQYENVLDGFMSASRRTGSDGEHLLDVDVPQGGSLFHPFQPNDTVFFVATVGTRREALLGRIRQELPELKLCCFIYDVDQAMDGSSRAQSIEFVEQFRRYLHWLSVNVDFLIFSNSLAASRFAALQRANNWPVPAMQTVSLGVDLVGSLSNSAEAAFFARSGIKGPFVLCVGTLTRAKNIDSLYRAWLLARETAGDVPQLVLCGAFGPNMDELRDMLRIDPRLSGKIVQLQASDAQLASLYRRCLFVIVPQVDSGSTMALPEALAFGKACLVADTAELREIGGDAVSYVPPYDVRAWAERVLSFASDDSARLIAEQRTIDRSRGQRWTDTAHAILSAVDTSVRREVLVSSAENAPIKPKPTIWMDLTTTFLEWSGHVTGITRAELTFAYYLKKLEPETRFFAHVRGHAPYFFEIESESLQWLFQAKDLTQAYKEFHAFWQPREKDGTSYRNPFARVGEPVPSHPAYLPVFPPNSIVFFAAIDQDGTGKVHRVKDVLPLVRQENSSMTSQLIYDLTPILIPQVHAEWTCRGYGPFVEFVSQHFDSLLYGGRTAQRDAIKIQEDNGWRSPPSNFVEFGSDLALAGKQSVPPLERTRSLAKEKRSLKALGITGDFVMTVGSIEPRKNHEMLYKAYLHLLESQSLAKPLQLVFIGRRGWKVDNLLATLAADERIKGKLLILGPSDEELEALYFNCLFTLLPSFYEGWSLTLPESLSYGKFCLVSDVDPLRETGGDLVEYIHPLDTIRWAERIAFYANNRHDLKLRETKIRQGWHPRTWFQSTEMLIERLHSAHASRFVY